MSDLTDEHTDDEDEDEEEQEQYEAEFTFTVKGTFLAGSQDEAESIASDMMLRMSVSFPRDHDWDDLAEDDVDFTVESVESAETKRYQLKRDVALLAQRAQQPEAEADG